jgi:hypothetical protein
MQQFLYITAANSGIFLNLLCIRRHRANFVSRATGRFRFMHPFLHHGLEYTEIRLAISFTPIYLSIYPVL